MDIVELTKRLVEFESVPYQEMDLVKFIGEFLTEHKVPYVFDHFNPGKFLGDDQMYRDTANIYIDVGHGQNALLLYAHTDVVKAKPEMFTPRIEGGWLIGRGTTDMKSALAGLLLTAINNYERIQTSGKRIIFSFVADEESSGTGARQNVQWLQEQNLDVSNLWCVLTEPTNDFKKIDEGGKGYIFLDLQGPLQAMIKLFQEILRTRDEILAKYEPVDKRFGQPYVTLTTIKCDTDSTLDQDIEVRGIAVHASRPKEGENALEKLLLELDGPVVFVNTGDNSPNTIPDLCKARLADTYASSLCAATIDVRTNIEADRDSRLYEELLALFEHYPSIEYHERDRGKAYHVGNRQLLELCRNSVDKLSEPGIAPGGSDAGYYAAVTAHVIGGFGPGNRSLAHTDDERIRLDVLETVPAVFGKLVDGFLSM